MSSAFGTGRTILEEYGCPGGWCFKTESLHVHIRRSAPRLIVHGLAPYLERAVYRINRLLCFFACSRFLGIRNHALDSEQNRGRRREVRDEVKTRPRMLMIAPNYILDSRLRKRELYPRNLKPCPAQ